MNSLKDWLAPPNAGKRSIGLMMVMTGLIVDTPKSSLPLTIAT
jgi:hypothetical protein